MGEPGSGRGTQKTEGIAWGLTQRWGKLEWRAWASNIQHLLSACHKRIWKGLWPAPLPREQVEAGSWCLVRARLSQHSGGFWRCLIIAHVLRRSWGSTKAFSGSVRQAVLEASLNIPLTLPIGSAWLSSEGGFPIDPIHLLGVCFSRPSPTSLPAPWGYFLSPHPF